MTLEKTRQIVETVFGVDISAKCRKRLYINARFAYFYWARHFTNKPLKQIGELIGRDHATVLHGLKTYPSVLEYDGYKDQHERVKKYLSTQMLPIFKGMTTEETALYYYKQCQILRRQTQLLRKKLYQNDTGRISKTV